MIESERGSKLFFFLACFSRVPTDFKKTYFSMSWVGVESGGAPSGPL